MLCAVAFQRAVPSVKDIFSKIFGLFKVAGFSGETVGVEQFPDKPFLIVIDILPALDLCGAGTVAPVDSVNRPLLCLGVGCKGVSSFVPVQTIEKLSESALQFLAVGVVEIRSSGLFQFLHSGKKRVDRLEG